MAGEDPYDDPSLTGISRYINGKTIRGRAGVALATYTSVFLLFMIIKAKRRASKKANDLASAPEADSAPPDQCH